MTRVVLENLYKTYPARDRRDPSADHLTDRPADRSADRPGDRPEAAQQTQPGRTEPKSAGQTQPAETITVLKRINLTIEPGEFLVLVGPSGCGKSTLLRTIAGLEMPTAGQIWLGDRCVTTLPPKSRDLAMVFQSYALYPHLTVYENLAFGLRRLADDRPTVWQNLARSLSQALPAAWRYEPAKEQAIADQVTQVARMLQIDHLLNRLPKELSGGQKQRVALGRAIARSPQVFLMDEPLSNLDAKLRTETRSYLVQLQRQLAVTTIYVTHDQTEAMTMGDRIVVLQGGEIQQIAPPLTLYQRPANRFVAEFIGSPAMNFLPVWVDLSGRSPRIHNGGLSIGLADRWRSTLATYARQALWLGVRPEQWQVSQPGADRLAAKIQQIEALGPESYWTIAPIDPTCRTDLPTKPGTTSPPPEPGRPLLIRVPGDRPGAIGEIVHLAIDPDQLYLFDAHTGQALYPPA